MKKIISIILLNLICYYSYPQIESIIWQQCLGTENEVCNKVNAVEATGTGYLFGIQLCENGPGVTNYHGSSDSWIVNIDKARNIIWERCFGGSGGETPHKILRVNDNQFYLLNFATSTDGDIQNGRPGNFWIVKINDTGEIIWENSYGGSIVGEEIRDAILMPDKGLLMMGRISSTGGDITTQYGDMDIWLCRIDSTGIIIWQKTFGNQGKDNAIKIKLTTDQTVMMIGCHYEPGGMIDCQIIESYGSDIWIVEMDLHGNILFQACYGGTGDDLGYDIIKLSDSYVFIASTNSNDGDVSGLHGNTGSAYDIWAVKIDFNGNIVWQKCLGGSSWEDPNYITETVDGGFIVIGNTSSLDGDVAGNHSLYDNYQDIWVVKLNSYGELMWEHCFGSLGTDRFSGINSVLKKDDFNFVIGANSNYASDDVTCDLFPNNVSISNAWLFEIKDCNYYAPNAPSNLEGPDTLCSNADPSTSYSVHSAHWATGYEWDFEPDNAGIISYNDTTALIIWNLQFEGPVNVFARSYNDCGNSAWSLPVVTQVYSCMGVEEQGGMAAWGHGGLEIWPNPASGIVDCRWSMVDFRGEVDLVMYDIFGRTANITILSSTRMTPTPTLPQTGEEENWVVDVSALPPGIYLAVVREGTSIVGSGKFLVVRE